MTSAPHIPVLLREVMAALVVMPGEIIVDATFGAGGYSSALLSAGARVIAFDRDPSAAKPASLLRASHGERFTFINASFGRMRDELSERAVTAVDGVVFDLGVSSMQLDQGERGFSFRLDGPLDMRMGDDGASAADLVNALDERSIADILFHFGEEKRSRAIARMIVARRKERPFTRTVDLAEAVARVLFTPGPERIHPATRTFQALRIAVNHELDELAAGLVAAEQLLAPGGRLAAVSFHSLEDRIIKRFLSERSQPSRPSRHAPESAPAAASFELLSRKAGLPGPEQTAVNPRARSAKLRAARRTFNPSLPLDRRRLGLWSPDLPPARGEGLSR